jgi:hypothetical protein
MLEKLQNIISDNGKVVHYEQFGLTFYIYFVDYQIQNHRNKNNNLLDNMDYWMPIIRGKFPEFEIESYFYNNNNASLWFKYSIRKHRKLKLKILKDGN